MIKKLLASVAAIIITAAYSMPFAMISSAEWDIYGVMDEARAYGFSEEQIQTAFNRALAEPEKWTQENYEAAVAFIHANGELVITTGPQVTNNIFTTTQTITEETTAENGNSYQQTTTVYNDPQTAPNVSDGNTGQIVTNVGDSNTAQTVTNAGSGNTVQTVTTAVNGTSVGGQSQNPGGNSNITDKNSPITLTMPDGKTFTRMSINDFIALSYADKQAYIATFTPEQQQIIINNLTAEEYRSLMKQAPTDKKAEIIDNMANAMQEFGVSTTVDELTDNTVKLTFRDKDGVVIGATNVKTKVEDTGYDRRGILAVSGCLCLAAVGGLILLIKKCFGGKDGIR